MPTPTKKDIQSAILALAPQGGKAQIQSVISGLTKAQLALMLESMQQEEGIAKTQAGAQAAAQAAAVVAQQGGSKRQVKAAAQAAAQATEAAMGGKRKASSGRSKSHSTRGKGRARKASDIRFKSKSKGMTTKASQAKNKTVIVQALKKAGVQASTRMTRAQLQAKLTQANRKKTVRKTRSGAKLPSSPRAGGVSPALKKDYNRVRALMSGPNYPLSTRLAKIYASGKKADGRLVVTQQLIDKALKPRNLDSFKSAVAEERYQMFLQFYKPLLKKAGYSTARGTMGKLTKAGRRMFSAAKSKARKKSARKSMKARYQAIKQQAGAQKFPYYLAKGYVRRIGGGPGGPGVVRVVPGTGATPFSRLSAGEKRKVLNYLNTKNGKSLRGKGAKRKVDVQGIINLKANEKAAKQQARRRAKAAAQKRKAAKGSSNQWWK